MTFQKTPEHLLCGVETYNGPCRRAAWWPGGRCQKHGYGTLVQGDGNGRIEWTPNLDAALAAALYEFDSVAKAAKVIGCTVGAAYARAHKLRASGADCPALVRRVRQRAWTDADDDDLKRRLEDGETQPSIAKSMGRTMGSVVWRIRELGLTKRASVRWPRNSKTIIRLRNEGKTVPEIAKIMRVQEDRVSKRVSLLVRSGRIESKNHPVKIDSDRLLTMRMAGASTSELATEFGCSSGTIINRLRALGSWVEPNGRTWTTAERKLFLELRSAGMTQPQIAERMGRSVGSISGAFKRWKP